MMTKVQVQLIDKLYEQTERQAVVWKATELSDQFFLKMQSGTILMTKVNSDVRLTVLDLKGEEIETIMMSTSTSQLHDLFMLVKRTVYRLDDALQNFVQELS